MRASVATATTTAAATTTTAAMTSATAGGLAIGFRRLRFARLVCVAGFARLSRTFLPALDLFEWPVKAPNHLAQRLDLAFVGGFLALGFLDQFEQFVHRLRCVTQGAERGLDFLECLTDGGR